ncbi:hypothetical protein [Aequorivita sp. CIP111184]|uniref:hypothetical protein n=1 Tax=Aequorivita sp. CIP111184 TaxID=2211356 RepID=UPI000DBC4499|nr:hypothetical protein [Aequorivita sp. CIP111184]SRX54399.1 hypothetical protein AEQU1_01409 [Aequorivita sp. CIP111184]
MMDLTTHIVDIFGWPNIILSSEKLDFADSNIPEKMDGKESLQTQLEKQYKAALTALNTVKEDDLKPS